MFSKSRRGILKLFGLIPEGSFKNKLRCAYYNLRKSDFKMDYKEGCFLLRYPEYIIKSKEHFYFGANVFDKGYLKNGKIKKGDVVIDAGAYPGDFTLIAANRVGENGKVIAYEPDPANYEKLMKTIKLNDVKNIIVVKKGLWSKEGVLKFRNVGSGFSSFIVEDFQKVSTAPERINAVKSVIEVPVTTIDNEVKRLNLKKVNFIKMDIEGAEIPAVKGARKTLKGNKVYLGIASYHVVNEEQTYKKLEKLFQEIGYQCETSFPKHLTTSAWRN